MGQDFSYFLVWFLHNFVVVADDGNDDVPRISSANGFGYYWQWILLEMQF